MQKILRCAQNDNFFLCHSEGDEGLYCQWQMQQRGGSVMRSMAEGCRKGHVVVGTALAVARVVSWESAGLRRDTRVSPYRSITPVILSEAKNLFGTGCGKILRRFRSSE